MPCLAVHWNILLGRCALSHRPEVAPVTSVDLTVQSAKCWQREADPPPSLYSSGSGRCPALAE